LRLIDELIAKVEDWDVPCVISWLSSIGCSDETIATFKENHITGPNLKQLDEDILKTELKITAWGDRNKIMQWIQHHKQQPQGNTFILFEIG
jgi:hypothetical protein